MRSVVEEEDGNELVQIGHQWMVRLLIVLFLLFVNLH